MQKHYTFQTQKSEAEVFDILTKYFKENGFYGMQTKKGIAFRKNGYSKNPISPMRFSNSPNIEYQKYPKKNFVTIKFNIEDPFGSHHLTFVDEEYFKDYFSNIQKTVATGEIQIFDAKPYDNKIRPFVKSFWAISIFTLFIGFVLMFFFSNIFDSMFLILFVLGGPVLSILYINSQLKKKAATKDSVN